MNSKHLRSSLVAALGIALSGCAMDAIEPTPAAQAAPGAIEGAIAAAEGVRMIARAGPDAWNRTPQNLGSYLTPVHVTLMNTGREPIRVAYNQFRLVSDSGRRFSAIPPFRIDGRVNATIAGPFYRPTGFAYAPYFAPYWPGVTTTPFPTNSLYWDRYGTLLDYVRLPTADMLRAALPEGVLRPGGRVEGFLYFEGVGPDVERVRLIADFADPRNGQQEARLSIPFFVS